MAALILEVLGRHGHQFHRIDGPVIRVGRALDNDVILPDPAVSPYHFSIRRTQAGDHELVSLADENGIRIGRRRIDEPFALQRLPLAFDAGRTHIRILDSRQPVAPTRVISCRNGGLCLFGSWGWALLLFTVMLLTSLVDNYLSTPETLTWKSFWRDQVMITMAAISLTVGLLIVNRIASHRWDYVSAVSFVGLMLIFAFVLDQLIPFLDYYFTSPVPGYLVGLLWILVVLPIALGWYLVTLNHGSTTVSIVFTILLVSPLAYVQFKEAASHYAFLEEFSRTAYYSDALYPWDIRLQDNATIDDFVSQTVTELSASLSQE